MILSIDLDTLNIVGAAWVASSESDRENKLSEVAYRKQMILMKRC